VAVAAPRGLVGVTVPSSERAAVVASCFAIVARRDAVKAAIAASSSAFSLASKARLSSAAFDR
jgi:hypothetical protein